MNTEDEFDKLFEELPDESVIFKGEKLDILIPEIFVNKRIASFIGRTLDTIGIFYAYSYNPDEVGVESILEAFKNNDMEQYDKSKIKRITFKIPATINLTPSNILQRNVALYNEDTDNIESIKYYALEFYTGDTVIKTTNVIQSVPTVQRMVELLYGGYMPSTLNYDEFLKIWEDCISFNGVNAGVQNSMLALVISELVRDKNDLTKPYRLKLAKMSGEPNRNDCKLIRVLDLPKYILPFSSLTSGDPKHGVTLSITNERKGKPIAKKLSTLEVNIS